MLFTTLDNLSDNASRFLSPSGVDSLPPNDELEAIGNGIVELLGGIPILFTSS